MTKRKRSKGSTPATKGATAKASPTKKAKEDQEVWSKSKKKRMRRLLSQQKQGKTTKEKERRKYQTAEGGDSSRPSNAPARNETPTTTRERSTTESNALQTAGSKRPKSALQQSFLARLSGSRFRELNEELYTTTSDSALKRFTDNPELFVQYHDGFRNQVEQWPVNPVDLMLRWLIKTKEKQGRREVTPQEQKKSRSRFVVADFGCGEAKLAEKLLAAEKKKGGGGGSKKEAAEGLGPFEVHSFDLVSNGNPLITPCDMADVPLEDETVDVGVFCLALMGTNIADFIREAHRVLRRDGILKIAEVRSRFEATDVDGKDDDADASSNHHNSRQNNGGKQSRRTDDKLLNEFIETMLDLGFECKQKDRSNKMFIMMEFVKTGSRPSRDASFTAKPCIYKRR